VFADDLTSIACGSYCG